ncbi:hypothetical protein P3T40_008544 [Paraburkholderia sp. EB58]|jgi:hypothetical protein
MKAPIGQPHPQEVMPNGGAQRNAGTDDGFVTNACDTRAHLVSDHSVFTQVKDTYRLAVAARFLCDGKESKCRPAQGQS